MKSPKVTPENCQGFALVIALSLMAFVLLLILSMATLTQVETESANISASRVEAEQNALLALNLALGELQAAMGPDQRVSATADIFSGGSTTASRKHTVGVWSSANVPGLGYNEGDLVTWLASDAKDASGNLRTDYNSDATAPTTPVVLVGAGSLDSDGDGLADDVNDEVIVDAQNTTIDQKGTTVGRYAWWISDEGVKARINLSRAESPTATTKYRAVLEAGSSSVANPAVLSGLSGINFASDGERLFGLNGLNLLQGGSNSVANAYFHKLTAHSAGVLADVKNGGLKKDLSLAFEMDATDFDSSEFGSGGGQTINAPGFGLVQPIFWVNQAHGPVWHLLRDYYRLYREMDNPMTNPTINARVFGPNVNHRDMPSPADLSASPWSLDQQPAALLAGGKTKFFYEILDDRSPFFEPSLENEMDEFPNTTTAPLDMAMLDSDPIRLNQAGDPLRGGGQSAQGTTMPVMVSGNYLPYMQRFVMEVGFWFERLTGPISTNPSSGTPEEDNPTAEYQKYNNPIAINEVRRARFIMHNPFNVTLQHDEIGLDMAGAHSSVSYTTSGGDPIRVLIVPNANKTFPSPKQRYSFRQARISSGSFSPGEMKTFSAEAHNDLSNQFSPVDYADEGTNPTWQKSVEAFGVGILNYIEDPANSSFAPYTMYVHGDLIGTQEHVQSPGNGGASNGPGTWGSNNGYSISTLAFMTHLKEPGNPAFAGRAILDRWPMASIVDTGLLLPGPGFSTGGGTGAFTRGTPAMFPSFFQNGSNSVEITTELINTFNVDQNPYILATYDFQLKPTEFDRTERRYPAFARTNPLAPVRDNKNLLPADDLLENSVGFPFLSPDLDVTFSDDGAGGLASNLDYWGPSDGSLADTANGVPNPALIELPTTPVLSIGKLQHANISVHSHMPALAIGNSLASPYINPTQTVTQFENRYEQPRAFYDLSYHMNEALWDGYFFSSYALPYDAAADEYGTQVVDTFDDLAAGTNTLPNPRMHLITAAASEDANAVKAKLFNGINIRSDAYARAAENLLVEGSFNVNSTSVDAWRAVLSGARNFAVYQSGEATPTQPSSGNTPFSRLAQPVSGESDGGNSGVPQTWSGFRSLNDTEVTALAGAIVAELRARIAANGQPYLSLADFVNRELTNTETGRAGLLQAAIDKANLNDGLKGGRDTISASSLDNASSGRFPFAANILEADGDDDSANRAAPAFLMQADILQAIGSFINVRSDTFRIRSYGESIDPITDQVKSRVWLEAIVQRVPTPVNPVAGSTPGSSEYWDVNAPSGEPLPFGRSFKVVSVRQLSEEDV